MTQYELSQYYFALSEQAEWMDGAIKAFVDGQESATWYAMLRWAESKHQAKVIADAYDTMAFARAIGMSDGIRKAWE
jgi:hypothetical protein